MARLSLNKSSLSRETRQLRTYQRFLPSLDLKRRQLVAERAKARRALEQTRRSLAETVAKVAETLPMLANENVDLEGIMRVTGVNLTEENVLGARLPVLAGVQLEAARYAYLGRPHWVDRVVEHLHAALELRVTEQVQVRRAALLDQAVQKITQRVNLFDKVLIPRARENIRRIRIYLADHERAAVVRAKIAKRKRAAEAAA